MAIQSTSAINKTSALAAANVVSHVPSGRWPWRMALPQLIARHKPEVVLAAATAVGRGFFARTAIQAQTGLTADRAALAIDPESGLLERSRPAFGGVVGASRVCVDAGWISSARRIGQTGKMVSLGIYPAFGLSGVGLVSKKTIWWT